MEWAETLTLIASHHVPDELYARTWEHFTEGELVEIGLNCAIDVGMGRLVATWRVTDDLPERFRESDEVVTPWGPDAVVVPSIAAAASSSA